MTNKIDFGMYSSYLWKAQFSSAHDSYGLIVVAGELIICPFVMIKRQNVIIMNANSLKLIKSLGLSSYIENLKKLSAYLEQENNGSEQRNI